MYLLVLNATYFKINGIRNNKNLNTTNDISINSRNNTK